MKISQSENLFTANSMFAKDKQFKLFTLNSEKAQSGEILHSHDYMQIWFIIKGVCNHWIEDNEHKMLKGDAFILPPYVSHKTTLEPDSEILCCEFSLDEFLMIQENSELILLKETLIDLSFMALFLSNENKLRPKFTLAPERQIIVEKIMRRMLVEYNEDKIYAEQFIRIYILEILLLFAREYKSQPEHEETTKIFNKHKIAIDEIILYINENYEKPLSLENVCKMAMMSKTYFCYLFKTITNQTFVSYLQNIRIQEAAKLLDQSNTPVTQICFDVGFNDLTHFSRVFKNIVGVSARTYRSMKKETSSTIKIANS